MMQMEHVAVGGAKAHNRCHVHTFEDAIVVDVSCRLEQEGEERGFLMCDVDAKFFVDVVVTGKLAEHLCFILCAAVHIECFGPADPNPIDPKTEEFNCHRVGETITFEFDIPAGTLCDEPGEADCGLVCCFAATVTSRTLCGTPGHISCVCRGPCVGVHREPAHEQDEEDEGT